MYFLRHQGKVTNVHWSCMKPLSSKHSSQIRNWDKMVIYDRKFFDPISRRSSFCLLRETNTVVVHACMRECVRLSCVHERVCWVHTWPCAGLLRAGNRRETKFALSCRRITAKMCTKINRGLCVCARITGFSFSVQWHSGKRIILHSMRWGDSGGCLY